MSCARGEVSPSLLSIISEVKIRIEHCDWLVWLVTKLAILAIKHGGLLLIDEVFMYSKDITSSLGYLKGWRIFTRTAMAHRPKISLRTHMKGF